ncbi:MAG: MATE family efflux transporter [Bacteroidetes bacterium]|nr:MATE family efflux transporter [Bacteroidota bacterium]
MVLGLENRYYSRVTKLATPVIIANAGQAVVYLADNIMVGQLGVTPLASVAFAGMIILNLMVLGNGMAISLTPLVGENYVNRGYRYCSKLLQNSLVLNTLIGLFIAGTLLFIKPFLSYLGQPQDIIDAGESYYIIVALSIIPNMIFLSFKQFMDGIGNTKMTMNITIACNVLNIFLNYIFIYGKFGCPAWGIFGAGLATFISRLLMPIIYYITLRRHTLYSKFFKFFSRDNSSLSTKRNLLVLGMPIAWQMVVEVGALSVTTIMFGWISIATIAAGQVVMSIIQVLFLIVNGISGATTILTSHEYGRRNRREIVKYTKASIYITVALMVSMGAIMILFRENLASVFSSDPEVIAIASSMIIVVSIMELFDGLQVTTLGALRGIKEVHKPMKYAMISYILVSLPMSYIGGFVLNVGASGIWIGFLSGLTVAFILFINRFYKIIKTTKFM